jgi:ABC-type bacteriocin/lantibiotic exporter with double-glycine peptidase domain
MRIQEHKYSCGAAAVANALRCLGKKVSEGKVRRLARTDKDGTTEFGVLRALDELGYVGEVHYSWDAKKLIGVLDQCMEAGEPVIIAADDDTHWSLVAGKLGDRYVYIDSDTVKRNVKENGVYVLSIKELLKFWRKPDGELYAISVSKK